MAEFAIDREGRWLHRGEPLRRAEMVRLFASMLRRDASGRHVLESPGQRVPVDVVDAAFVAVSARWETAHAPPRLWLGTDTGVETPVDREHPLYLRADPVRGERRLYHRLDGGLEALVHRSVFYQLAEMAESDAGGVGLRSDGVFFPLA